MSILTSDRATSTPLVTLNSVTKRFGSNTVLENLSLEIQEGEFLTFLGESGSGKTTLLRLIAGFETVDHGEIWMADERLDTLPPFRRRVNTVFQQYALFPHLSVFDNVAYGLRIAKVPREATAARVNEALAMVKMTEHASKPPSKISGGQQQRVALARALVNRPRLLLLDEPLSALDANLRTQMQVELKSLQREVGITFVFVTHDQQEAMAMSDRVALLRHGKLEQVASPQEIYSRPATAYVAGFIGQSNLIPCNVSRNIASSAPLVIPCSAPDGPAVLSLRPESIKLSRYVPQSASAVRFRATIVGHSFHGASTQVRLRCSSGLCLYARISEAVRPEVEEEFAFLPADALPVRSSEVA